MFLVSLDSRTTGITTYLPILFSSFFLRNRCRRCYARFKNVRAAIDFRSINNFHKFLETHRITKSKIGRLLMGVATEEYLGFRNVRSFGTWAGLGYLREVDTPGSLSSLRRRCRHRSLVRPRALLRNYVTYARAYVRM